MIHLSIFQHSDIPFWIRFRIQLCIVTLNIMCLFLKTTMVGAILGPVIDVWPCVLFYLSFYTSFSISIVQINLMGLAHDGFLNTPLGLHGVCWTLMNLTLLFHRKKIQLKSNKYLYLKVFMLWNLAYNMVIYVGSSINPMMQVQLIDILLSYMLTVACLPWSLQISHSLFNKISRLP